MFAVTAIILAGLMQLPAPDQRECYDFDLFDDAVKITQTIETPSFPPVARMLIVTRDGTKEVFAATARCSHVFRRLGMDGLPCRSCPSSASEPRRSALEKAAE